MLLHYLYVVKFLSRSIRPTVNTKRTIEGFDTLPFGYEQEESKQQTNKASKQVYVKRFI